MTSFDLTNHCNLKCVHCIRTNDKQEDLSVDQWISILEEFYTANNKFVLAGGEPLLYPGLEKLLKELRGVLPKDEHVWRQLRQGFSDPQALMDAVDKNKIVITTNGTPLTEKNIDLLEQYGVVTWISLDGATSNTFDSIRLGAQLESLLTKIRKAGEKLPIHINYVVMEQTANEVIQAIELANELDVNLIRFTPVREINQAKKNGVQLYHQQYADVLKKALDIRGLKEKTLVSFNLLQTQQVYLRTTGCYDELVAGFDQNPNLFLSEKTCQRLANPDRGVVNPKGGYTGCCNASSLPYFNMGSLLTDRLESICNNEKILDIFKTVPAHCQGCEYLSRCQGGCRLMSYEAYGDPLIIDPTCPFIESRTPEKASC